MTSLSINFTDPSVYQNLLTAVCNTAHYTGTQPDPNNPGQTIPQTQDQFLQAFIANFLAAYVAGYQSRQAGISTQRAVQQATKPCINVTCQ